MSITHAEVERVARLAKLDIEAADVENRARDLARILEMFDRLAEVDTEDVEPLAHPRGGNAAPARGRGHRRGGPDRPAARRAGGAGRHVRGTQGHRSPGDRSRSALGGPGSRPGSRGAS